MIRFWYYLVMVGLILGYACFQAVRGGGAEGPAGPQGKPGEVGQSAPAKAEPQIDVLKLVQAMNRQADNIPSQCRKGHVNSRRFNAKAVKQTKNMGRQLPTYGRETLTHKPLLPDTEFGLLGIPFQRFVMVVPTVTESVIGLGQSTLQ